MTEKTIFPSKEVALIKKQASRAVSFAQELQIKTKDDLEKAVGLLAKIKTVGRILKATKEKFTKPANEIMKSARDLFLPFEQQCIQAESIVKEKMIGFNETEELKAKKKKLEIQKKVVNGEISPEEAAEEMEKIIPDKTIKIDDSRIQYKVIKEVIIDDLNKIPREYLVPDMVRIRKEVLEGKQIAGVKIVEKKIVASYC